MGSSVKAESGGHRAQCAGLMGDHSRGFGPLVSDGATDRKRDPMRDVNSVQSYPAALLFAPLRS